MKVNREEHPHLKKGAVLKCGNHQFRVLGQACGPYYRCEVAIDGVSMEQASYHFAFLTSNCELEGYATMHPDALEPTITTPVTLLGRDYTLTISRKRNSGEAA